MTHVLADERVGDWMCVSLGGSNGTAIKVVVNKVRGRVRVQTIAQFVHSFVPS